MKRSHTPDNELQNSKNRLKHNTSMDKSGSIQCGVSSTAAQCPPSQHSSQQCCSVGCRMQVPGRLRDKKLAAISEQIMSAPDCLKHSPPLTIRMRKVMIVNICDAEKTKMMAMRLYLIKRAIFFASKNSAGEGGKEPFGNFPKNHLFCQTWAFFRCTQQQSGPRDKKRDTGQHSQFLRCLGKTSPTVVMMASP